MAETQGRFVVETKTPNMAYWANVQQQLNQGTRESEYIRTMATGWSGGPAFDPDPSLYANQARLMQQLSWVYSAVSIISRSIASLANFQVMKRSQEKKEQIVNHPFEQLLRRPNPYQFASQFEFFEAIAGFGVLSGNVYMYLNALSPELPPAEMYLLRPDRVMVVPDKDRFVRGYVFNVDGRELLFDRDEIVHIKTFHPLNDWYGLSAIEALSLAAETDFKEAVWNKNFFDKQHAKPQGALAYADMISDSDWNARKADMMEETGGVQRRMLMLRGVGKGGVQWLPMGLSQKDMEFIEGRQFNKEEIYQVLAPGLISILDKNTTEANSSAGEKTYREYALYPLLRRIGEMFVAQILPRYGEDLDGEFEEIRVRDRTLELTERQAYERVHTVAEVREKFDGDEPLGDERDNLLPSQITSGQGMNAGAVGVWQPVGQWQPVKNAERANEAGDKTGEAANENPEAKAADTSGVMIALDLPPGASGLLEAMARAELGKDADVTPAEQMHLTLAYLGGAESANVSRETLTALVRAFASQRHMLHGTVNGVGRFAATDSEGRTAFYVSFDSPDLPAFHNALIEWLDGAGVVVDKTHGFVPHITLAYIDPETDLGAVEAPRIDITFDAVTLAWGGEWTPLPLGAVRSMPIETNAERSQPGSENKALIADLGKWEEKALRRLRDKKSIGNAGEFESKAIPALLAESVRGALEAVTTPVEVKAIFDNARSWSSYP